MTNRHQVKSFVWTNGIVHTVIKNFDSAEEAIDYAKAYNPAETIKVYDETALVYSQYQTAQVVPSYA